jgi:hypothetical protein
MEYNIEDIRKVMFQDLNAYMIIHDNYRTGNDYLMLDTFSELMAQHLDNFIQFLLDNDTLDEIDYTNKADVKYLLGEILNGYHDSKNDLAELINKVYSVNRKYHLKEELSKLEEDKK